MKVYNILILAAGRRVELVQEFQKAAKSLNLQSNIVAGDCDKTAPALYFADEKVILPKIKEPNYIDEIIRISNKYKISLIIPTIDTDLLLLSKNKDKIEKKSNAKIMISNIKMISICRDKIKTQKFLEEHGFLIPKMYSMEEIEGQKFEYPLFIKPKSGSSSINAFKVNDDKDLKNYLSIVKDPIIQDFMEGEEYTVDVFTDFSGKPITITPRLRIATRSGEISKGKIIKDREIIENIKELVKTLNPIGHITVQLMKTKKGIEYIEINPRFGGGAPMSIQAGANSCENLFKLLLNEELEYNEDYDETLFLRFDQSIKINPEEYIND